MQNLAKPIYPIVGVDGKPLDLQPPSLLFRGLAHGTAGSGFQELYYILPPVRQEIISVYIYLGQYSKSIEAIVQCKGQTEAETDLSREVYLTVRLSAIPYAVHVTLPLPRSQHLRQSLLEALYDKLCTQNVSLPVILWCVAVAMSMLDETGSVSNPLISYMARLSQDVKVTTPNNLVALPESFAWIDAAFQYTRIGILKRAVR
ncbi:hypothetical protein BDW75DRAFT_233655 [Aspergillus navahoensis]